MKIKIKGDVVTLTSENKKDMENMMKYHLGLTDTPVAPTLERRMGRPKGSKNKPKETTGIVTSGDGKLKHYTLKRCPECGVMKKSIGLHYRLKHQGIMTPVMRRNAELKAASKADLLPSLDELERNRA